MAEILPLLHALYTLLVFPGFLFLFVTAMLVSWVDRRVIARLQGRVGPPFYQPLADWIKLMAKEDILPVSANERASAALPVVSLAAVLTASIYIPVSGLSVNAFEGDLIVVLFLLSIPPLAYFLGGWVTGGVYSVIGGNRSLLQYFSYEVPFLMALSCPAILSGSWSIATIAARQSATIWGAFVQPVGFLLAVIGLIGKLKRTPFDIPKAKSEIVAGPLTEFSGRKLALWQLTMQINTVVGIFLLVNAYLGGSSVTGILPTPVTFALKALLVLLLLSFASVLYARLRIDQLANLGWRVLAPLALLQIAVTLWNGG
ncbi:MAG: NADH-quinone oxidoreductase subunit H [Anaerolineae bacterium]|nr:NADH-quinone oxidoreductase subunit H [Anaerolineae bacterium]